MCKDCGCGMGELHQHGDGTWHSHTHEHNHDKDHSHGHDHSHEHDHSHSHSHESKHQVKTVVIDTTKAVLAKNDSIAQENRLWFLQNRILCLNFISSPGSGKTLLLEIILEKFDTILRKWRLLPSSAFAFLGLTMPLEFGENQFLCREKIMPG